MAFLAEKAPKDAAQIQNPLVKSSPKYWQFLAKIFWAQKAALRRSEPRFAPKKQSKFGLVGPLWPQNGHFGPIWGPDLGLGLTLGPPAQDPTGTQHGL